MKLFIAVMMLGVLDLVQGECKRYKIPEDLKKLCEEGQLADQGPFATPSSPQKYYKCVNKTLTELECNRPNIYFNPFKKECTSKFLESVAINAICGEVLINELMPYLDYSWLEMIKNNKMQKPNSGYFVKCTRQTNPELYMCYEKNINCVFDEVKKVCKQLP